MDLLTIFRHALPGRDWTSHAHEGALVAFFAIGDWRPWLDQARLLLDVAEASRVAQRRIPAQRDALALTYALHRMLLADVLSCDPRDVPLSRDAQGCPRLVGLAMATSLSHSDDAVAIAVSAAGPVGIDIEPTHRASVMSEIAERVCHPLEAERLLDLPEPARSHALLALWVRKEALLKAEGIGMAREMESFLAPDGEALRLSESGPAVELRLLKSGARHIAALAAAPGIEVRDAWLSPG